MALGTSQGKPIPRQSYAQYNNYNFMGNTHQHLYLCHHYCPYHCFKVFGDKNPKKTLLLLPRGSMPCTQQSFSRWPIELNSGFSGPPASDCLFPFPWQIAAFSSQQLLVQGPEVPGRPFPQDHGTAVPRWPVLCRLELGPKEMESPLTPWTPLAPLSSFPILVFLGTRKPSVITWTIYSHISTSRSSNENYSDYDLEREKR